MSPTSQSLRRRSSRSTPATITAIVLLALAVAGAWIGISRLITGTWPAFLATVRQNLSGLTWSNPGVWAAAILLALIGLILLLAAILPGKHTAVRLTSPAGADDATSETAMSRRGLAKLANAHLDRADGVDSASVRATAKKVTATVRTPLRDPSDLSGKLKNSLERKFDQIGVDPAPRVTVRVISSP